MAKTWKSDKAEIAAVRSTLIEGAFYSVNANASLRVNAGKTGQLLSTNAYFATLVTEAGATFQVEHSDLRLLYAD